MKPMPLVGPWLMTPITTTPITTNGLARQLSMGVWSPHVMVG